MAQNKKRKAFTLAEVLITLGVIGVVAAITVPTLMNNTQDKQFKVAWKKAYADINQALATVKNENSSLDFGMTYPSSMQNFLDALMGNLQYVNKSYSLVSGGFYFHTSNNFSTLSGNACLINNGYPTARLNNGTLLYITFDAVGDYIILVDINGFTKPNTVGKDIFGLSVERATDAIKPAGAASKVYLNTSNTSACYKAVTPTEVCDNSQIGWGCSREYLYD